MFSFPKILYLLGYAFSSQRLTHSYFYYNQPLPLDARWLGQSLGFFVIFVFWLFNLKKRIKIDPRITPFLIIFVLYYAFDALSSTLGHSFLVTNETRLISGFLFYLVVGLMMMLVSNDYFWPKAKKKMISGRVLGIILALGLIWLALIVKEINVIMWVTGVASILGLVLFVFSLNSYFLSFFIKNKWQNLILGLVLESGEFLLMISLRNFLT